MNHKMHLYLMGGLVALGVVLLFTSGGTAFGGTGLFLLVFLGFCFAIMFFIMGGMGGMGGGGDTRGHQHAGILTLAAGGGARDGATDVISGTPGNRR